MFQVGNDCNDLGHAKFPPNNLIMNRNVTKHKVIMSNLCFDETMCIISTFSFCSEGISGGRGRIIETGADFFFFST